MHIVNRLKKLIILLGAALIISLVSLSTLNAADAPSSDGGAGGTGSSGVGASGDYLQQIAINTAGMLKQLNNLPSYLQGLGEFITSWMTNDTSKSTETMQGSFAGIGSSIVQDNAAQLAVQPKLAITQFSRLPPAQPFKPTDFTAPLNSPTSILQIIPNINDLAYSTLLGQPLSPKAPKVAEAPLNYVANASGITLNHTIPSLTWQGPLEDQLKYQNYYNTLMSIESFNAYILSGLYAEAQNGNTLSTAQSALVAQASNSSWLAQIATEELGKVLRQILMFQSQSYVLLTQLLQVQKQTLAAQVMSNSLIIANGQISETVLISNAQGVRPQ